MKHSKRPKIESAPKRTKRPKLGKRKAKKLKQDYLAQLKQVGGAVPLILQRNINASEWYDKLAQDGFDDIETTSTSNAPIENPTYLKRSVSSSVRHRMDIGLLRTRMFQAFYWHFDWARRLPTKWRTDKWRVFKRRPSDRLIVEGIIDGLTYRQIKAKLLANPVFSREMKRYKVHGDTPTYVHKRVEYMMPYITYWNETHAEGVLNAVEDSRVDDVMLNGRSALDASEKQ